MPISPHITNTYLPFSRRRLYLNEMFYASSGHRASNIVAKILYPVDKCYYAFYSQHLQDNSATIRVVIFCGVYLIILCRGR